MLRIPKKKLVAARILTWSSFGLLIITACVIGFAEWRSPVSVLSLLTLLVICFSGSAAIKRIYRCPKCGRDLLIVGTRSDILLERLPQHCPHCGHGINVILE